MGETSLASDRLGGRDADGSQHDSGTWQVANKKSWALGSDVAITALHHDQAIAESSVTAAMDQLHRVDALMSIYRTNSQVSQLNREGIVKNPHPYLVDVLRAACDVSRRSDGAFDVTVQPLWQLYRQAKQRGDLPDAAAVKAARSLIDWRSIEMTTKVIRLRRPGAAITLNGIAQGFAADRVAATLRVFGIRHALVDTGEIAALGRRQNRHAWTVGIQHPRREDAFVSLAKLAGRCLATSGDYATTFTPDFRHNHLFDPHTGRSPTLLSSVSVCAATAMQADALATTVSVLGPTDGIELIRRTPGADALLVLKGGAVIATDGFPMPT